MTDYKIKILFVFATAAVAGLEIAWRNILERIQDEYQIQVLIWGRDGPLVDSYHRMGIPVGILGADEGIFKAIWRLFRILRSSNYDIVVTSGIYPDMVVRMLRAFCRIGVYVTLIPGLTTALGVSKLRLWLLNVTSTPVDKYLFNSENNALLYRQFRMMRNKVDVMKLGVDYLSQEIVNDYYSKRHSRNPIPFRLICVANMSPVKNHRFLLDLFDGNRERLAGVELLLVGKGALKSELQEICRDRKIENIEFREDVPAINDVLGEADAFIFASHFEGTPMAIMEAMNAGLPVIAYQSEQYSGVNELVRHSETGLLMNSFNHAHWLTAIVRLADDPGYRALLGRQARELIREYSLPAVSASTRKMIFNWMENSRSRKRDQ